MTRATELMKMYWQMNCSNAMPVEGLVFYAPLDKYSEYATTGQSLVYAGTPSFGEVAGIKCAYGSSGIRIALAANVNLQDNRTYSAFCRFSLGGRNNGNNVIFAGRDSSAGWTFVRRYYDNNSLSYWNNGWATGVGSCVNDTWYHIAITYNGAQPTYYANGALQGSLNIGSTATDSSYLGIGYVIREHIENICAARIYNRVLTQSEITTLAHEFTPTA